MGKWKKRVSLLLVVCLVLGLMPMGALASATVTSTGTVGEGGAPWRLYSDGTLVVDEGFIEWTGSNEQSPWHEHRHRIDSIVFTGPIIGGTSLRNLFRELRNVFTIEGLHYFDTSNVIDMSNMFVLAQNLMYPDVSHFDTSNVTDMEGMFANAHNLRVLDLSNFDTSNVTSMGGMFMGTYGLTSLDLSSFNTSNVTRMSSMFNGAYRLTNLDLSGFDTSNVTCMAWMFAFTRSLTHLDLSSFDTGNVTYMDSMFRGASNLRVLDLSNFDTSNVTSMFSMFVHTPSLRQLILGERFSFIGDVELNAELALPPQNADYTGRWQNIGSGTVYNPQGEFVFTAAELMENYDGATMADTWVWQPRNPGPPPPTFHDVAPNTWYHDYVQFAAKNNLMLGTGGGNFSPHTPLNRAMLATIFWRVAGEPEAEFQPVFSDVPSTAPTWYRDAVIWAHENSIVQGYGGRFDPYGEATREQFAVMLHRYAQFAGMSTSVPDGFDLDSFRDRGEISAWAEVSLVWAVYQELIRGVGDETLAPDRTATRGEGAALLMRFMQRFADQSG